MNSSPHLHVEGWESYWHTHPLCTTDTHTYTHTHKRIREYEQTFIIWHNDMYKLLQISLWCITKSKHFVNVYLMAKSAVIFLSTLPCQCHIQCRPAVDPVWSYMTCLLLPNTIDPHTSDAEITNKSWLMQNISDAKRRHLIEVKIQWSGRDFTSRWVQTKRGDLSHFNGIFRRQEVDVSSDTSTLRFNFM